MADEEEEKVRSSSSRLKRSRIIHGSARKHKARHLMEFHGALESLEIAVANITEFVVILSGCDRIVRRPYDTYLYIDNFVFGRHSEKQMLLSLELPLATQPCCCRTTRASNHWRACGGEENFGCACMQG
uniref:Uncharacterized protein n=1 Tax=Triticum urartu TaxID=4572 RepID=A0A8R7QT52_TRIUA